MKDNVSRWMPAVLMMGLIFWFSSRPAEELPYFGWADFILKKTGHVIEYALLGALYWRAFGFGRDRRWMAWLLSVLYALTDEFHQSFVPGRFPSILDALIFDNFGALLGLWFSRWIMKHKQPD